MHITHIVGRLGADPEEISPTNPIGVRFNVATERYNGSTKQRETTWSKIKVFGKDAEFCRQYLKKGRLVEILAHYEVSEYQGKTGPMKDHSFVADRIEALPDGSKPQQQQQDAAPTGW